MLEIDGSYGEGGGQIVRSAISLSAVTETPVRITKIRAKRKKPGLAQQHITAIKAVAKLCNGKYTNLKPGISTLEFTPGNLKLKNIKYYFDIGTAGSITMVLQACMPLLVFCENLNKVEIKIRGGTDVNWSPPIDYFNLIFLENLKLIGLHAELVIKNRGYYPKGGGEVVLKVKSGDYKTVNRYGELKFANRGKFKEIIGVVHSRMLPAHVPQRISQAASECMKDISPINIRLDESKKGFSPGTGIVLAAKFEQSNIGASALGAKGVPSEQVGTDAALALKTELAGSGTVDIYAADQLIPYLAILGGIITVRELSLHAKTNLWLAEQFIEKKFIVEHCDKIWSIRV
jgi:RNA 3'-terminal phosphate cyclase (ATP)